MGKSGTYQTGFAKLTRKTNHGNFYAEVEVTMMSLDKDEDQIITIEVPNAARWRRAYELGISLATLKWPHVLARWHIRVTGVKELVGDTNDIAVAFATYAAIADAIKMPFEELLTTTWAIMDKSKVK